MKKIGFLGVALLVSTVLGTAAATSAERHDSTKYSLDIPSQNLNDALQAVALVSGYKLLYASELVDGRSSPGLTGKFTTKEAVKKLLDGTDLTYEVTSDGFVLIRDKNAVAVNDSIHLTQSSDAKSGNSSNTSESSDITNEEVVVTGTLIRGTQPSSPVVTITQEQMRLSGHNSLGEAVRSLPQSFSGGQNPGATADTSLGNRSNSNATGGSSINLRGLGPDATLTLLNGARLPFDGLYQATDISTIPISAIDRVEVLLDGASAIYGSDAVGGVANVILKRDYEGLELSARYGVATDGGNEQEQYTGVGGLKWGSGGFLATYDYATNDSVQARERDYLGYMPGAIELYPALTQKSALLSGHQALGDAVELALDAFHSDRAQEFLNFSSASTRSAFATGSSIYTVSPSLRIALPGEWSLRTHGSIGRNDVDTEQRNFSNATGLQTSRSANSRIHKAEAAGVEAEGGLFALPGGQAKIVLGGGYRRNSFQNINRVSGVTTISGDRRSHYGFGELNLPLVAPERNIRAVRSLSIVGAARYEDYDDFGDITTPKAGLIWGVTSDLDIKASWGKSFKAPRLVEQYQSHVVQAFDGSLFGAPAGTSVLLSSGGNRSLRPETAETLTAGFVLHPQWLSGATLEVSYFDIDYTNRVVEPITPFTQALTNPIFAEFVALSPSETAQTALINSADQFFDFSTIGYDPATVYAIANNQVANATLQRIKGVDVSLNYVFQMMGGTLTSSVNVSWLDSDRKVTSLAAQQPTAGMIYFPPEFRGRGGAAWSRGALTLASYLNYIAGVKDTNIIPNPQGGGMTTVDMVIDYRLSAGPARDIGINLAATNLFDRRPPFLQPIQNLYVNYDSTNYSGLGRMISATVTKKF